jgi:excisionase family DNA binding protein
MLRRLLNVIECAHYIASTPLNVYQMVSKRLIPFVKIGRSTRFDLRAIDAWIEGKKIEPWSGYRPLSHDEGGANEELTPR